ncbi:hypothetical protein [Microbacterium sp. Leaf179]|uniref:hypothetical protein n=1 Tax=Microbacterium sp. Leaf179 TaxID=1736288 RepID=UPI000700FF8C|nr:hypothetical protein [Microbacterium sp. Leaf179]KQR85187.1 hypothetical protein ASF96_14720 [Microbacterium sp. Leaf179]
MTDNDDDTYRPPTFSRSVLDALSDGADDTDGAEGTGSASKPRQGLSAPKEGRTVTGGDTTQHDKREWLRAFNDPNN